MSTATRRAIYGSLTSNNQLNQGSGQSLLGMPAPGYTNAIYHDDAPQAALYPFIVFSKSSGVVTEAFGKYGTPPPSGPDQATRDAAPRVPGKFEDEVWLIKAIDLNSTADLAETIADVIKAQLNDQTINIAGSENVLYLRRQSDVEYAELVEGDVYRHSGSLYRLTYD